MTPAEIARLREQATKTKLRGVIALLNALEQAQAERDAARALLQEAVPHIKGTVNSYRDGWIDKKQALLARIAKELGE